MRHVPCIDSSRSFYWYIAIIVFVFRDHSVGMSVAIWDISSPHDVRTWANFRHDHVPAERRSTLTDLPASRAGHFHQNTVVATDSSDIVCVLCMDVRVFVGRFLTSTGAVRCSPASLQPYKPPTINHIMTNSKRKMPTCNADNMFRFLIFWNSLVKKKNLLKLIDFFRKFPS